MDLHFTIDTQVGSFLSDLAGKNNKNIETFAREIFLEALEQQEDIYDLACMAVRDVPGAERVSHEDAWK